MQHRKSAVTNRINEEFIGRSIPAGDGHAPLNSLRWTEPGPTPALMNTICLARNGHGKTEMSYDVRDGRLSSPIA